MGKILAGTAFFGGCVVLRSLVSPSPDPILLYGGYLVVIVSLIFFIRELTRI